MSRVYHENDRAYDSSIRTAALAVLLSVRPSVQEIRNVMLSTINQTDKHIATYVLGTMTDLASQKPSFRYFFTFIDSFTFLNYIPALHKLV